MSLLRALFGWIARHALLFVLILAVMVVAAQLVPDPGSRSALQGSIATLDAATADVRRQLQALEGQAVTGLDATQRTSLAAIDARLAELARQERELADRKPGTFDLLRSPRDAIVANARREIDLGLIAQEVQFLTLLRTNVATRGRALSFDGQIARHRRDIAALDAAIAADAANIAALPSRLSPRRYLRGSLPPRDLATIYRERQQENRRKRDVAIAALRFAEQARREIGDIATLATPNVASASLQKPLAALQAARTAQSDKLETAIERAARLWYVRLGIHDKLWPAIWILIGIVLAPFAIRTLFYWVLAPLATLQRPIQLLADGVPIPLPTERSSVSRAINLRDGQQLLVRQGFVQSVSLAGTKATQWLLNARHPFSSLASGLYFLTRIEGQARDVVTVSATRDPFAEIAVLSLPAGAAAVLQPRAIAGVVQPVAMPLRITSHWRLGTLNAWLTWQLRFLVFHGPAEIILTGGRGVRIEAAVMGRSIGQDQLIGFSAGIAYTTGRTETFIPYLFGGEPLLKDRIAAGAGVLIAEEAPMNSRSQHGAKRGLEGVVDALLKPLGI